ncbi:MAG: PAS domain S-box protein, partial [Sphingobacteriales bacterium]
YVKSNFQRAFTGEKIEYEYKHPGDDAFIWFEVTYSPVTNADGEIINVCVGINDITNKKMAELQLINSEKRFREVLSSLGDNVWEHDFRTGETYFSERVNELAVYDNNGINDTLTVWWNSTHEEDRWMLDENYTKYKEGIIDHHSIEYRILYKDGSVRWVLDRGVAIEKDPEGKPLKIIGTHTDVTKQKQVDEEIKANEAKFRAIFNSTFQFIGLMTTDGILLEANQTATDFFRLPKEEVMGMNFVDSRWFSESTREKSKQALVRASRGETVNYELELNLLDGRNVIIDFTIRPILDAKGNAILLIPEGRDITDKLRMEKEIERERLSKQKEILLASIEGQEKQREEVARELHDNINQVLATIKIYLQLAGENEDMREGLIAKSYENISHAIEEVRKLSRALAPPTLDDITLVEALQQMVNDMAISKLFEIDFSVDSFDEGVLDNLQKMTVYRVVQEQFTNILKYANAKKINMSLVTSVNEIILTIKDDGVGFDLNKRSTGIGIKNMRSRVETHNGHFDLDACPGKGCNLTVILPVIKTLSNAENKITNYRRP